MGGARVGEDGEVLVAIHDEAITPTVSINKKTRRPVICHSIFIKT
jgi:hypothetical protein